MRRVLINMQNFLFGDAIAEALRREETDFDIMKVDKPEQVMEISSWYLPHALLMEVTGYTPWLFSERLKIRNQIKEQNPNCKVVLIVDENAERKIAQKIRQAKKDGIIDNFIYASISATYLSAIMDAL